MDRFDICLPYVLAQECPYPNDWTNPANFSNDSHDGGGKTFCGIIQREYDVWRKAHGQPCQDIRQLTQGEGEAIYRESYWLPHCPNLPPGLDLSFLDESVNTGTTEATKVLQTVLGLDNDGLWGPLTSNAVTEIQHRNIIINAFTLRRQNVYRMMPGFPYFGNDWIKRAQEIGAASLTMSASAT